MQDNNKEQLSILTELSSWTLGDLGTKMNRKKIETLITIQVHQRDVFADLTRLYKERKVSSFYNLNQPFNSLNLLLILS